MTPRLIGLLVLLCAPVAAQEPTWTFPKKRHVMRPLEFEIAIPDGWTHEQDHMVLVAADEARNGFIVSREPLLYEPKRFAKAWGAELKKAEKPGKVSTGRAGSHAAWTAKWSTKEGRQIEVWRVHVPKIEMVYNFSFSAKKDLDIKPLVKGVLKSFKCTAPETKLEFQQTMTPVGNNFAFKLPRGYEVAQGRSRFYGAVFLSELPGYKTQHIRGAIGVRGLTADRPIALGNQVVQPGNVKDFVAGWWDQVASKSLEQVVGRPKISAARYAGTKGAALTASGLVGGLPKRVYIFVGKLKRNLAIIAIMVDERETRLHKNLFKKICSTLKTTR